MGKIFLTALAAILVFAVIIFFQRIFPKLLPSDKYPGINRLKKPAKYLLIILILELTLFNIRSAPLPDNHKYREIDLQSSSEGFEYNNGNLCLTNGEGIIRIQNINAPVGSVYLEASSTSRNTVNAGIDYGDSAIGYSDLPVRKINEYAKRSRYIPTSFSGDCKFIEITLQADRDETVIVSGAALNKNVPFSFNIIRVLLIFIIALFLSYIKPSSKIHKISWNPDSRNQKSAGQITVIAMCALILFTVFSSLYLEPSGKLHMDNSHDIYHELSDALARGQISLLHEPPEELAELQNPYDINQRGDLSYVWDSAYYNGKYYAYFGIAPVLLTYLPFRLITGTHLHSGIACALFSCLGAVFIFLLLKEIALRLRKRPPLSLFLGGYVCLVMSSLVLICARHPEFYETAILSGFAFVCGGIFLLLRGTRPENRSPEPNSAGGTTLRPKYIAGGATLMAAAVACRPDLLIISLLTLPIILPALRREGKMLRLENLVPAAAFCVPYVIIGALLMIYNFVRFGNILEFGASYQLTVFDAREYKIFDLSKLPVIIWTYLLRPPELTAEFPFLRPNYSQDLYFGYYYLQNHFGLLWNPLMLMLPLIPWGARRKSEPAELRRFLLCAFLLSVIMCVIVGNMGGTAMRYAADFAVWMALFPVVLSWLVYAAAKRRGLELHALRLILTVAAGCFLFFLLLSFTGELSYFERRSPGIFYWAEYSLLFWK